MANSSEPPKRFQVSLRTYLIAVLAAGLTLGILGQLLWLQPDIFAVAIYVLATIVPFVLAIGTVLWIGFHRSPIWSLPVCATCRRDLRWFDLNEVASCPECGADLTASKALAFERSRYRSGQMIAWGFVLLLMPVIGIAGTILVRAVAGPTPGNLGLRSNQEVIQKRLLPQVDQPWVWQELERRLAAGKLSQKEVDEAVKILIGHMTTTKPNGWDEPFHWQDGFLKAATSADLLSDPVLIDLCDAFFGTTAELKPLERMREGRAGFAPRIEFGSRWDHHFGAGVKLLWEVTSVKLDGKPLPVRRTSKNDHEWSGYYDDPLPAGEHEVTFEIECAYIDNARLAGLKTGRLPARNWPEALKRWQQTLSTRFTVHTTDEQILEFVTDFDRSPERTGGIQVNRLVVLDDLGGGKRLSLNVDFNENLVVPIAFDVVAKLGEEEIPLGYMHAAGNSGWSTRSGTGLEKRIDTLDPDVRTADLILTPNPKNLERYPQVKELWGEKIIVRDVPLERFDLVPPAANAPN